MATFPNFPCNPYPCDRFYNDHATAALIWNYKTREELKEALDAELRAFTVDKELGGKHEISWNHTEFEVRYLYCFFYLKNIIWGDYINKASGMS